MLSKSYSSTTSTHQRAPFSPEIREFIANSRRQQTFFANCEASSKVQVERVEDKQLLVNRIYYSLFSNESDFAPNSNPCPASDDPNLLLSEKIVKKMISISNFFGSTKEIYFSIVWVYYFVYKTKTVHCTPVFKVYRTKDGKNPVVFSTQLCGFNSWDCFLEFWPFSESFLCFPRNGEYTFKDKLDLEYVRSSGSSDDHCKSLKPFSQSVLRPMLDKVLLNRETLDSLIIFAKGHSKNIVKLILCGAACWIISKLSLDNFIKIGMMLFGIFDLKNILMTLLPLNITSPINKVNDTSLLLKTDFSDIEKEIQDLIMHFNNPKRDWDDILLTLGSLLGKSMRFGMNILGISRLPKLLQTLFLACTRMSDMKAIKSQYRRANCPSSRPNELENLRLLEETSLEKVENIFNKTFSTTDSCDEINSPFFIEEEDGLKFYFIPNKHVNEWMKDLQNLVGFSNLQVHIKDEKVWRVKNFAGNIVGSVYFVKDDALIGVFPSKYRETQLCEFDHCSRLKHT